MRAGSTIPRPGGARGQYRSVQKESRCCRLSSRSASIRKRSCLQPGAARLSVEEIFSIVSLRRRARNSASRVLLGIGCAMRMRRCSTRSGRRWERCRPYWGTLSAEVTREIYLHSVPADARSAVEKVEELLNGPKWTQVAEVTKVTSTLIH